MLESTPERAHLRCPVCRDARGSRALAFGAVRVAEGPEVLDADLVCTGCGAVFPVRDGVAVVLRDVDAYLAQPEHDPQLGTYLHADYARDAWPLPPGLRGDPHPVDLLARHVRPGARVVDLGCGTGGAAFGLARTAGFVLGIDLVRPRVEAAIRLRRTGSLTFAMASAMGHTGEHRIDRPDVCGAPCDFLVGDAIDPPLAPDDWDACLLGMVYDVVREPGILLGQAGSVLVDDGLLLVASPYQFTERTSHRPADPAGDLRWRLGTGAHGTHFTRVDEEERLWILRDDERRFFAYLVDVVLARKVGALLVAEMGAAS